MIDLAIQTRPNPVLPTSEPRSNGTSTALSFRSILSRLGGNIRQLHHEQGNSLTQMPEIRMGPDSNLPPRNSSDKNGYVLACINGFHTQPELFHLHWKPGLNDRTMFMQMQRQYHQARGKWKRSLSLWSLHSVLFIQVYCPITQLASPTNTGQVRSIPASTRQHPKGARPPPRRSSPPKNLRLYPPPHRYLPPSRTQFSKTPRPAPGPRGGNHPVLRAVP